MPAEDRRAEITLQLPDCMTRGDFERALRYLQTYYGRPYTGSHFDSWAGSTRDPDRITADDVIAVSFCRS